MQFRGSTIFVTGGAGFIGSAVIRYLLDETEANVVNIDKLTYASNLGSIPQAANHPRYRFSRIDICDGPALQRLFVEHTPTARQERRNIDVVREICRLLDYHAPARDGSREELITFVADRPGHDRRYAIDPSKIERELGWRGAETFETRLAKTVRWYLESRAWWQPILDSGYKAERIGLAGKAEHISPSCEP